eukprot:gene14209-19063_t
MESSSLTSSNSVINLLKEDIWVYISTYLHDLKYFIRLWVVTGLFKLYSANNHSFWNKILQSYVITNKKPNITLIKLNFFPSDLSGYGLLRAYFSNRICQNSGCGKSFREFLNYGTFAASRIINEEVESICFQCCYHPGKLNKAGYLTCCREKGFCQPGCKVGTHNGKFYSIANMKREPTMTENNITEHKLHVKDFDSIPKCDDEKIVLLPKIPQRNVKSHTNNNLNLKNKLSLPLL